MYMGVILTANFSYYLLYSAPHVYGGDPIREQQQVENIRCSPCIWG